MADAPSSADGSGPRRPAPALLAEAAGWIAEQLAEDGVLVAGELVEVVLDLEWDGLERGLPADDRAALVATVCTGLAEEGVLIGPPPSAGLSPAEVKPVPPELVQQVMSWEDEFLNLAGLSRAPRTSHG